MTFQTGGVLRVLYSWGVVDEVFEGDNFRKVKVSEFMQDEVVESSQDSGS